MILTDAKLILKKASTVVILFMLSGLLGSIPLFANTPHAYAATVSVSTMTDAVFFGVWDGAKGQWSIVGKLNYDDFPGLAPVQASVKAGNYEQAKTDLLNYYKYRTIRTVPGVSNTTDMTKDTNEIKGMLDHIAKGEASSGGIASYPSYWEAGGRTGSWVKAYHRLKNSPAMNTEANTDILKTFWLTENYLGNGFYGHGNHATFTVEGSYFTALYFPEFTASPVWLSNVKKNINHLVSTLTYSDGAYQESSDMYTIIPIGDFSRIRDFGSANGDTIDGIDKTIHEMIKYLTDISFPNGRGINLGDSYYTNYRSTHLRYYETPPNYTSILYPVGKIASMRSGWLPNDRHLTTNLKQDTQHRHPDDNAITYYAYGRPLLIDPGKYNYSNNPVSNWLRFSTESHNTIEINDTAQNLAEGWFRDWTDNRKFSFVTGVTHNVPGFTHARETLFLKSSFSIVSDYVQAPLGTNKYQQTWHFTDKANPTLDAAAKKTSTRFSDANLQVVPADPDQLTATLDDGYYAENEGSYTTVKYTSYTKNVPGDISFDTILYPTQSGETRDIKVSRLGIAPSVPATVASSLKIDNIAEAGTSGYYYLSHEEDPRYTRSFDTFTFDGKLAYAEKKSNGTIKSAILKSGTTLKNSGTDLIASKMVVSDMSVDWNGTAVEINGSNLVAASDPGAVSAIAIRAPGATTVKLNGAALSGFTVSGDYIYAVGVSSMDSSKTLVSKDLGAGNTGARTIEFDLIPTADRSGGIIGYTGQSMAANDVADLPIRLRLNENGYFEAWDGTKYAKVSSLAYEKGATYHVTIQAYLFAKKYNLYIAPKDKPEVQIADQFALQARDGELSDIGTLAMQSPLSDQYRIYNHDIREAEYYEIPVSDDATVYTNFLTRNQGGANTLELKNNSPHGARNILLRFDLRYPAVFTPEFSQLELTAASEGNQTHQIQTLNGDSWKEGTVTYGTMPAAGKVFSSWKMPPAEKSVNIDLQTQVAAELAGDKQLSLMISSQTITGDSSQFYYAKERGIFRRYAKVNAYPKRLIPVASVEAPVMSALTLNGKTQLSIGQEDRIVAQAVYDNSGMTELANGVTFRSTVPSVAVVNAQGLVSALQVGTTVIEATYGEFMDRYRLTVTGVTTVEPLGNATEPNRSENPSIESPSAEPETAPVVPTNPKHTEPVRLELFNHNYVKTQFLRTGPQMSSILPRRSATFRS